MLKRRSITRTIGSMSCLLLLILLLSACGGGDNTTKTGPTPPSGECSTAVNGTIQSINGSSFTIKTQKGESLQIKNSNETLFSRQSEANKDALKADTIVEIEAEKDNPNNALIIVLKHLDAPPGGMPGGIPGGGPINGGTGTPPSLPEGTAPNMPTGTPPNLSGGTPPSDGSGGLCNLSPSSPLDGHSNIINGSVKQTNDNNLTITTTDNTDQTLTITDKTKIISIDPTNANALTTGALVNIDGPKNSDGSITAQVVTIVLTLPSGS